MVSGPWQGLTELLSGLRSHDRAEGITGGFHSRDLAGQGIADGFHSLDRTDREFIDGLLSRDRTG